jgi:hypothetical protein
VLAVLAGLARPAAAQPVPAPSVEGDAANAEYPSAPSAFGNIFWKHGWVLGTRTGLLISLVND